MIIEIALILSALLVAGSVFMLVHSASHSAARALSPPDVRARQQATTHHRRPFFWLVLIRRAGLVVPERLATDLSRKITMAGGLEGMTPAEVVLYALLSALLGLAGGTMLVALTEISPAWGVGMFAIGAVLPFIWLRDQVKRRHLELMREMPFHLDLLTLSVEAGLDFGAAVARMVDRGRPGALIEEFNGFLGEIRMGKTRAEALEGMAERVGLPALSNFLGSLIQADRLGSGLGRTLRLQAEQLRIERFQLAEKLASEAPVKMLLPLVLFIFPTIWIILAAPLVFEWIFKAAT